MRAGEVAVVGDRLYTDIAMARGAGAVGVLVLTGETRREQVEEAKVGERPDLVVESVRELGEMLEKCLKGSGSLV